MSLFVCLCVCSLTPPKRLILNILNFWNELNRNFVKGEITNIVKINISWFSDEQLTGSEIIYHCNRFFKFYGKNWRNLKFFSLKSSLFNKVYFLCVSAQWVEGFRQQADREKNLGQKMFI